MSVPCSILKGDMPMDISWAFNGVPIDTSRDASITVTRISKHLSTLSIDGVSARHAGEYACSASNLAGSVSRSATLTVNGTRPSHPPPSFPFLFAQSPAFIVTDHPYSSPPPRSFHPLLRASRIFTAIPTPSSLIMHRVERAEASSVNRHSFLLGWTLLVVVSSRPANTAVRIRGRARQLGRTDLRDMLRDQGRQASRDILGL